MRISSNQIYQKGIDNIMTQQERALKLQEQLTSGLRVEIPSDDPIAAAQIELMSKRISTTELLQKNRQAAESALSFEESILSSTVISLQRLRDTQIQAGNSSLSEDDRKALAVEVKNILNQLQGYANTKDANGSYMFSGGQTATQAVSLNTLGQYVYNGDSTQRYQGVTGNLQVAMNDTADSIFMRIPNGNGRFAISQTATPNTGTASVSTGSVVNSAALVPDNYTMSFSLNSQGKLVVLISGAATGNIIPSTGLPDDAPLYQDGAAINFNGMEMTVTGAPQAGDSFYITPAKNESVFSTVQRMITNLNKPFSSSEDKAATQTENNQLLAQLDSAISNVLNYQADLGARLNQLESANTTNLDLLDASNIALKQLRELTNPSEVAAQYNLQLVNLEVAQQSFVRIQGLSIFNYM